MCHPLPASPSSVWDRAPLLRAPSLQSGQGLQIQDPGSIPEPLFSLLPLPLKQLSLRTSGSPLLGNLPHFRPHSAKSPPTPHPCSPTTGFSESVSLSLGDSRWALPRAKHTKTWAAQTVSTQGGAAQGSGHRLAWGVTSCESAGRKETDPWSPTACCLWASACLFAVLQRLVFPPHETQSRQTAARKPSPPLGSPVAYTHLLCCT